MTEAKKAEKLMLDTGNAIIKNGKIICTEKFENIFLNSHNFGDYDTAYKVNVTNDKITFLYNDGSKRMAYGQF